MNSVESNRVERTNHERASPFFWWVRVALVAAGAVSVFPIVFGVAVVLTQ